MFWLDQQGQTADGQSVIHPQGLVATGQDREAFREQLHAEALRRGLGQADEALGHRAVEATCAQDPCQLKRTGQFGSPAGVKALLCLDTFWHNERWPLLLPHTHSAKRSKNCNASASEYNQFVCLTTVTT